MGGNKFKAKQANVPDVHSARPSTTTMLTFTKISISISGTTEETTLIKLHLKRVSDKRDGSGITLRLNRKQFILME
jgi:hypothetical protein